MSVRGSPVRWGRVGGGVDALDRWMKLPQDTRCFSRLWLPDGSPSSAQPCWRTVLWHAGRNSVVITDFLCAKAGWWDENCAPTARAMPVHAVLGLTMKYHMKFQGQVATKSVLVDLPPVSSLAQPRNSGQVSKITLNGRGFNGKWAGLQKFSRDYIYCPPNLQHLPTPMQAFFIPHMRDCIIPSPY